MGVRTGSIFPGPGPGGASDGSREGSTGSFQENINMFDDIEEEEEGCSNMTSEKQEQTP